ncbi:MAG TPA: manganese efflux pump [Candidatus Dormibacteraeota bacterium]|nr:manganese efflux pump [Candidatus Dormibacteraeota bacterium]
MRQLLVTAGLLLPLGLDTFALGAALGVAGLERRDRLRVSLIFTLFEAVMPLVGMLAGQIVGRIIGAWAGYGGIAFLLLAGFLLVRPGKDEDGEERRLRLLAHARGLAVLDLGLSISVDELTVGLSAGLLGVPIALAIIWIAVQAFAAAQVGLRLGGRISEELRERSEQVAGFALVAVALVLLGLKLLNV